MPVLQNPLNKITLNRLAGSSSYQRGQSYFRNKRVKELKFSDNSVEALIQGSELYKSVINLKDSGISSYNCSCPAGGFCKHLVALGLDLIQRNAFQAPASITKPTQPSVKADLNSEMSLVLLGILSLYSSRLSKDELAKLYRDVTGDSRTTSVLIAEIMPYKKLYQALGIFRTDEWKINKEKAHDFIMLALKSKHSKAIVETVRSQIDKTSVKSPSWDIVTDYYYTRLNFSFYTNDDTSFIKTYNEFVEKSKYSYHSKPNLVGMLFFVFTSLDSSFTYSEFLSKKPYFQKLIAHNVFEDFVYSGIRTNIHTELMKNKLPHDSTPDYEELYLASLVIDLKLPELELLCRELLSRDAAKYFPYYYLASSFFLKGEFDQAMKIFDTGLKTERKKSRSSQNTVMDTSAFFYVLLLIKQDRLGNIKKIDRCISKNDFPYCRKRFILLLAYLEFANSGDKTLFNRYFNQLAKDGMPTQGDWLEPALMYLISYFIDQDFLNQNAHRSSFDNSVQVPILALKLINDVIEEIQDRPAFSLPSYVTKQNLISFTQLYDKIEVWQSKLELLKQHFGVTATPLSSKNTNRFVWILDSAKKKLLLKKQQILKNGKWSAGRTFELNAYLSVPDNEGLLSLNEKNILAVFEDDYYSHYGRDNADDYSSIDKAIIMLCGMKNVYADLDANQCIDLELTKPAIELKQNKPGFYRIKLSHDFSKPTVFLEKTGEHSYAVVACGQELLKLKDLLGKTGIELPAAAEADIKTILKAAEADLEVVSDLEFEDLPIMPASNKAYALVYFDAYNFKLKLEVLMNPAADGLNLVQAATGRELMKITKPDNTKFICQRNFTKEKIIRDKILMGLELESDTTEVEGIDACLDLIGKLESYKKTNSEELDIEWKQGEKIKILPKNNHSSLSVKVKAKNNWFEYSGEMKLDEDRVLSLEEILASLQSGYGNYVKLNTGEFLGLTEELKKSLQKLKYISDASEGKLHKLAMNSMIELEADGALVDKDQAWQEYIDKLKNFNKLKIKLPVNFNATLRDYQYEGFVWLSRLAYLGAGACLADDMGLGKTVQTIAVLLQHLKNKPCMVVAPTSVVSNWQSELDKFSTKVRSHILSEHSLQGDARKNLLSKLKAGDVLLCSYGLLQNHVEELSEIDFGMLVLDESQAIKNPLTKRALAAKKLQADFRMVLTGTPIENNLSELWSQFDFINPGLLGSLKDFQGKFANAIEINKDKIAQATLKQLIQPYILRRTKDQVLSDLPAKIEQTIKIEFDPDEAAFYEVLRKKAIEKLENSAEQNMGKKKLQILAEMSKLRRACCHPSLVDAPGDYEGAKNKEFLELVNNLKANNHRALVFSQYTSYLKLLRKYLDMVDINYLYLDGSTPAKKRKELVNQFQNDEADLFLLSLKAGGSGLNLTNADYVIHLDPWWNPAVEDQATDRAHRIGQQKTVNVYRLIMKASIEEKILQLHDTKRELADELLDEANISGKLSDKELLEMMRV